ALFAEQNAPIYVGLDESEHSADIGGAGAAHPVLRGHRLTLTRASRLTAAGPVNAPLRVASAGRRPPQGARDATRRRERRPHPANRGWPSRQRSEQPGP